MLSTFPINIPLGNTPPNPDVYTKSPTLTLSVLLIPSTSNTLLS